MTKQVQRRRGTATQHTSFTGAEGEISVNTTNKSIHVHDGVTAGGIEGARADMTNVSDGDLNSRLAGNTLSSLTITSADINGGTIDGTVIGGTTPAAGNFTTGSFTGNATFGDNDKAIFGAGSDLQIYHDGQNSIINEGGTGDLEVQANRFVVQSASGADDFLIVTPSGGVDLRHNAGGTVGTKLATTSTGVDITGTLTSDGLTVDGAASIKRSGGGTAATIGSQGSTNNPVVLVKTDESGNSASIGVSASVSYPTFHLQNSQKNYLSIGTGGDISFYEDTGTTPKFFWDASAESLGIGTASVSSSGSAIEVNARDTDSLISDQTEEAKIKVRTTQFNESITGSAFFGHDRAGKTFIANTRPDTTGAITFLTGGLVPTERMRIDSSGNLLVGKSSQNIGSVGFEATPSSSFQANASTASGKATHTFNRLSSDGDIATFRKDNSTVGSIGTILAPNREFAITSNTGQLYCGIDGGSYYGVFDGARMHPSTDNAMDLGASTVRFKDLYLSGGVYLGGTGSANKLDDYETGTWTPSFTDANSATYTGTYTTRTGTYTKIGRTVVAIFELAGQSPVTSYGLSSGIDLRVSGLPFTPTSSQPAGSLQNFRFTLSSGYTSNSLFVQRSSTYVAFREVGSNVAPQNIKTENASVSGTGVIIATFTYEAA